MSKYTLEYKIPYYDSDKNRKLTPIALLTYLGETSGSHTDSIGLHLERMLELGYAWMLNRWKLSVNRYPSVGEKIKISTWTSKIEKFYAYREFLVVDENNNEICRATTIWILFNMEKLRPARIPQDFIDLLDMEDEQLHTEFYDFKDEVNIDNYIDFHVRRLDIDYNNHVNNTKYLAWILESVGDETYENYQLEEFEIIYKKEVKYGNTILSGNMTYHIENQNRSYLHEIKDYKEDIVYALGKTQWTHKN